MASSVTITAPAGFFQHDWANEIPQTLYDAGDVLGQLEQFNVMSRTPVLTGALQADVSYEVGPPTTIAFIYSDTANQMDAWGREYDIYQEGGILGAGSNNGTGNNQMYAQVMTTDIPDIEAWGAAALQGKLDSIAAGGTP